MDDKLLKTVTDELCKHFNDPIDIECSYCEAAKAVIPLVRADTLKIDRKRIQAYIEVLVKNGDLKINDGVLLWDIIQNVEKR